MQLYLINTKKTRNINQLHINTFTYQKKLRTFKTKTANIYQCFFLGTNKAEYPTIYSLYFLYYYLKSDLKYRKFNLYVCTFNNTYKKGKIPRFKHVMQFQKIQESQSFLHTLFWRGSLQLKKWFLWYLWHGQMVSVSAVSSHASHFINATNATGSQY